MADRTILGFLRGDPPAVEEASRPLQSLTAAARRITGEKMKRSTAERWQDEAWSFYDTTGELRFVANALANGMSRARLFAARMPAGDDEPQPINLDDPDREEPPTAGEQAAVDVVTALGGGLNRAQLIHRLAVQMFVAGDGWIVGLPPGVLDDDAPTDDGEPPAITPGTTGDRVALEAFTWQAMSVSEVSVRAGMVSLQIGDGQPHKIAEDRVILIRCWRPHPRRWWTADSPVRANLPVLRELEGLTKHVGASIDSRLAGAGLLVLPNSVEVIGAIDPDNPEAPTPGFVDALMEAMTVPIADRDSAAAVVPLVIKVPDEVAAQIDQDNLIRFSTPFDERTKDLRDEAIRRLALGLDAPAETLLGLSTANHWTAWAIDESTIKTHIDPVLALICDALTTQYLWPALADNRVDDAEDYVIWFDTVDLTLRPNRAKEAGDLYDRGELSGAALRRETGFSDEDAPPEVDQAVRMALEMVTAAPSLLQSIELATLVAQIRAVMDGTEAPPTVAPAQPDGDGDGEAPPVSDPGVPDTRDDEPLAASSNGRRANILGPPGNYDLPAARR